ncbi:PAS domain S-box protein [Methanoplanus endosymbiosus]|uniref:PAS domain S-box protein n=1 Tax=Methanoplanus endosymbiosus TaxID=33865 RepID=A0A9E7PPI9_9EURY|nr:PAS domain S-box protein [Methanoplanus endosymbiosus]UUX93107.1 PAS domain S-box protein [Methanoplanus endosymbiosus]
MKRGVLIINVLAIVEQNEIFNEVLSIIKRITDITVKPVTDSELIKLSAGSNSSDLICDAAVICKSIIDRETDQIINNIAELLPDIPIILITDGNEEENREEELLNNIDLYIEYTSGNEKDRDFLAGRIINFLRTIVTEREKEYIKDLSLILNLMPGFSCIIRPDMSIYLANDEFIRIFGEPDDRTYSELTGCLTADSYNCPVYEVLKTKEEQSSRWTKDDGRIYSVHDNLIKGPAGGEMVIELGLDITKRVNAEEKAGAFSKKLKEQINIINKSKVIIYLQNRDGQQNTELISDNISQFGYSPDDFTSGNLNYTSLIHPDDLPVVTDNITKNIISGNEEFILNYRIYDINNNIRFIEDHVFTIYDNSGKLTHLQGIIIDITEKKRSEDTIRIFKTVSDNANYGIAIADLNGILTYTNRWFADLHGYSQEELSGKPINFLHSGEEIGYVNTLLDLLKEEGHFEDKEVWHRHKSGRVFLTRMNANIISDKNNNPLYLSTTLSDITEEKEKERIIRDNEEKIRLKLESILSPDYNIKEEELRNIINTKEIQSLMDDFYRITDVGIAILDIKGNILVAAGWQEICTKFHRINPETKKNCTESDLELTTDIKPGEIRQYKCKNNLWDIATPIYIAGRHMGNMYLGQFFYEDEIPDYSVFEKQAEIYGFDRTKYLAALEKVPHFNREKIRNIMSFYKKFALMISKLSYSNIKLARLLIEHKETEKRLKSSEEKYRSYIDRSPEGIFVADEQGRYVEVNKAACEMLGYTEDELLTMSIPELVIKEESDKALEYFEKLKERHQYINEINLRRKDNSACPVIISTTVLPDRKYLAFSTDITNRKEAESKISQLNRLLGAIRNINRLIVGEKSREKLIEKTCRILTDNGGYTNAWIILLDKNKKVIYSAQSNPDKSNNPFKKYIEEGNIPGCAEKAIKSGEITVISVNHENCGDCPLSDSSKRINRLTGNLKYKDKLFGVISISIPDGKIPDGEEYNLFSEVSGDLGFALNSIELEEERLIQETEILEINKRLTIAYKELEENEEELRQSYNEILESQEKLRESENRLSNIINFLPDATFAIDKEGRVITWNKAMEKMTGISASEIIGKGNYEYSMKVYGKRRPLLIDFILNDKLKKEINYPVLYEEGNKLIAENYVPYLAEGKGAYIWFTASPLYDSEKNIVGAIESMRDISEVKSAEEKIVQTSFELSERVKELTALKDLSDLMIKKPDEDEFFNTAASIIKNAMQYPESTGVLIETDGKRYQTEGFYETDIAIKNDFYSDYIKEGSITVCYLNHSPNGYLGEFLNEEKDLLGIICERIENYIDRKNTEIDLKNSEERFRELFNNMSSGVSVYEVTDNGSNFIFKDINKASEEIDSIRRDNVINRSIYDIFPGAEKFGLIDILKRVWKTGKPEHYQLSEYKDERIHGWRENFIYRLPSGEVVTVYNDLTDKKRAEDALKKSERKYHELFNNINEAVFLHKIKQDNEPGNFVEVNDIACHRLGYTREELLKLSIAAINSNNVNKEEPEIINTLKKNEQISFEAEHKRKDGSTFPVHVKARMIELGEHQYVISLARDITEEKEARIRENTALHQIEENIAQLAILNDKIRNPLTIIIGLADLGGEIFKDKIIEQSMEINDIITRLDRGWLESAKIRDYLTKHHGIESENDKNNKNRRLKENMRINEIISDITDK